MRQIGTISDLQEAETFEDYLLTRNVKVKIDGEAGNWAVWVIDEDDVEVAKGELVTFQENSSDPRYAESHQAAVELRKEAERLTKQAQKKIVNVSRHWQRPLLQQCPVTIVLIAISVVVAFGTKLGEVREPVVNMLSFLPIDNGGWYRPFLIPKTYNINWTNEILSGQIWRPVTPMFIHYGIWHILFNMLWLRNLGLAIEFRRGSFRFCMMVLAIAIASNLAQYLYSGPAFGGMSGVVFGLFGYIWMKGRIDPQSGFFMPPNLVLFMVAWFLICLTGMIGPIANMAHGVGLIVGMLFGTAPTYLRNWLQR